VQTLTITNLNIFLEAALTPKPLKFKNTNSLGVGGPLKLKFANHLSKASLQGTFGTGRLHSELWDWGVKLNYRAVFSHQVLSGDHLRPNLGGLNSETLIFKPKLSFLKENHDKGELLDFYLFTLYMIFAVFLKFSRLNDDLGLILKFLKFLGIQPSHEVYLAPKKAYLGLHPFIFGLQKFQFSIRNEIRILK